MRIGSQLVEGEGAGEASKMNCSTTNAESEEASHLHGNENRAVSRKIVVVCTANICRSQMAETIFRKILDYPNGRFVLCSRGIRAVPGRPMDPCSAGLLRERGYQLRENAVSTQLTRADMTKADLVLVMEFAHRDELLIRYPEAAGKTWLLGHWLRETISDPYGAPRAVVAASLERIEIACSSWVEPLLRSVS
jgi:protein-tyrosine phosphatase